MQVRIWAICCACLLSLPLLAKNHSSSLARAVDKIVLKNGMTFLLVRRSEVPVFSVHIDVKVGGIEEGPGQSGLAHLLEHMAFKGTPVIGTRDYVRERALLEKINAVGKKLAQASQKTKGEGAQSLRGKLLALEKKASVYRIKGEFERLYEQNGAKGLNASTSKDFTSYYVSLPKNRLELWAILESERFMHPVMREFYLEKDVVIQERRERTDNNPMGKFYERFLQEAFGLHPYGIATIGSVADLVGLSAEDLEDFFNRYYTPERMVGALVGDLPPKEELTSLLERSFGRLNRPAFAYAVWPEFKHAHSAMFEMALDAEPALFIGYPKPTAPTRDDMAFDLLANVLCAGDSSRLVRALVITRELASSVSCDSGVPGARLPHLFVIEAKPFPGVDLKKLLSAIDEEIAAFKAHPLSRRELEKARYSLYAGFIWSHESNSHLANTLAYYESLTGDWRYVLRLEKTMRRIGARELLALAKRYLDSDNRTVGFLNKAKD